jgi:hypothetical protein
MLQAFDDRNEVFLHQVCVHVDIDYAFTITRVSISLFLFSCVRLWL